MGFRNTAMMEALGQIQAVELLTQINALLDEQAKALAGMTTVQEMSAQIAVQMRRFEELYTHTDPAVQSLDFYNIGSMLGQQMRVREREILEAARAQLAGLGIVLLEEGLPLHLRSSS